MFIEFGFYLELFFYFSLAGVAIVTWERIKQGKEGSTVLEHFKIVYLHLLITLLFTVGTIFAFNFCFRATESQVGIVACTVSIFVWSISGYCLKRFD